MIRPSISRGIALFVGQPAMLTGLPPCTSLQFETLCYQRCTHTHTRRVPSTRHARGAARNSGGHMESDNRESITGPAPGHPQKAPSRSYHQNPGVCSFEALPQQGPLNNDNWNLGSPRARGSDCQNRAQDPLDGNSAGIPASSAMPADAVMATSEHIPVRMPRMLVTQRRHD